MRRALLAACALAALSAAPGAHAETTVHGLERPSAVPPRLLSEGGQAQQSAPLGQDTGLQGAVRNVAAASAGGNDAAAHEVASSADTLSRLPTPAAWAVETPVQSGFSPAAMRAAEEDRGDRLSAAPSDMPGQPEAGARVAPTAPRGALPAAGVVSEGLTSALDRLLENESRALREAYASAGFQPVWISEANGSADFARAQALVRAFGIASHHALPAERYDAAGLKASLDAVDPRDHGAAAALEISLTKAYVKFGRDIGAGFVTPAALGRNVDVAKPEISDASLVSLARNARDMDWLLEDLAPRTRDYAELKRLYNELTAKHAQSVFGEKIPGTRSIRQGDRGKRIEALRARLIALGFLDRYAAETRHQRSGEVLFDDVMFESVKAFQDSKGLVVDGIVGANTLSQLNMDPTDRIRQIAVNLERARWHNRDLGHRRIMVNIPEYMARVYDGAAPTFETRVVVGKPRHQTAEFSGEMTHMVVNPTWNVPYSIATKEFLPQLQKDPYALEARNINVLSQGGGSIDPGSIDWEQLSTGFFPYRLRQAPGRGNALGDVKFMFPNKHSIYLHDTPSKSLFDRTSRAFSHGCVRVARPVELAEFLMAPEHADPAGRYQTLTSRRGEQYEHLATAVPVHIVYRTAWVDDAGVMQFRRDIYGRDKAVAAIIEASGVRFPGS